MKDKHYLVVQYDRQFWLKMVCITCNETIVRKSMFDQQDFATILKNHMAIINNKEN